MDKNYLNKVKKEIYNIKKYATEEELSRLNFDTLAPDYYENCIYGQMTGSCFSIRGTELVILCCRTTTSFKEISDTYVQNVKPRKTMLAHSYLEHYIYNYSSNNKHIIDFLRGEVDKLTITLNK